MNAMRQLQSARRTPPRDERTGEEHGRLASLVGGGTAGNANLTAATGLLLVLLFAVIGVTILRIGQLIWPHLFVGLLLLGPVLLKLSSTGYRFVRYYTRDPVYRRKGPPELALRLLAPFLVLTTVIVFVSGIVLMFEGPAHRGLLLLVHKASFILWLGLFGLHILGHLPGYTTAFRNVPRTSDGRKAGDAGRAISIAGALVAGAVLAIILIPQFGVWTQHFPHHQ